MAVADELMETVITLTAAVVTEPMGAVPVELLDNTTGMLREPLTTLFAAACPHAINELL